MGFASVAVHADPVSDRRAQSGLRLFKALIAANEELEAGANDGKLTVVFLYRDDLARARALGEGFASAPVRGLPVAAAYFKDSDLEALAASRPAAVFLADAPEDKTLERLVAFSIQNKVILYSPFEGHVEKGVLGGLSVEAQVRPYVNLKTLAAANLKLKPFFMKVAKVFP